MASSTASPSTYHPRPPMLPSSASSSSLQQHLQRFSPAPDYVDSRRSFHAAPSGPDGRLPLRESTGNNMHPHHAPHHLQHHAAAPPAPQRHHSYHGHMPQQHHQPHQASSLNGMLSCYSSPVTLSPSIQHQQHHQPAHAMPPAPMVPSQSFDCLQRPQTASHREHHPPPPQLQHPRYHHRANKHHARTGGMGPNAGAVAGSVNPLYWWPAFRQYRHRQAHKDTQKDKGGVWRKPELEDAFVDGELDRRGKVVMWNVY